MNTKRLALLALLTLALLLSACTNDGIVNDHSHCTGGNSGIIDGCGVVQDAGKAVCEAMGGYIASDNNCYSK